jgi:hypothetical protein
MKAERNEAANTLRGTLLLRWRTRGLSQSTEFIIRRRLPAFIPQKVFRLSKN